MSIKKILLVCCREDTLPLSCIAFNGTTPQCAANMASTSNLIPSY
jgi:hypothetical protein